LPDVIAVWARTSCPVSGSGWGPSSAARRAGQRQHGTLAELTAREREVLAEVGSRLSNTEIAGLLHISEATVKTHVGHVMAKLGLRDRIHVVVYAYETGLIRPGAGKN
jgi:DNA-binding NarL/FixJ family response regulator